MEYRKILTEGAKHSFEGEKVRQNGRLFPESAISFS
jgi:hypothetical protein